MLETTPSTTITPATTLGHHGLPPSPSCRAATGRPAVADAARAEAPVVEVGEESEAVAAFPPDPAATATASSRVDHETGGLPSGPRSSATPDPAAAVPTESCAAAGVGQANASDNTKPVTTSGLRTNLTPTADNDAGTM
jgi:hypothetical protein